MHNDALRRTTVAAAAIASTILVASAPAAESAKICPADAGAGVTCDCTLASLRPLQGAVGLGEVAKKTKDIKEDEKGETDDLLKDPIKVVRGPDNALFVVDHHHGARAWLNAGKSTGTCVIQDVLPSNAEGFRAELKNRKWVHLKDKDGADITWEQLPAKLTELPDDPYRTLAWMVRKADGFCRTLMKPSPPPFAEFIWADFFRARPELPLNKVKAATAPELWEKMKKKEREAVQKDVLHAALTAAGNSGQNLPGWNGKPNDKDEYNPVCAEDPKDDGGIGG